MKKKLITQLLGAAALALALPVQAQDYPSKPIKIVVPFAAGGGADIVSRIVAEKLQGKWGQGVIVENRAGAGGNVGSEAVFRAAPDGYTVLLTTQGPLVVNKALYAKLAYEPEAFVPVSLVAAAYGVLVVNPKVAANNVQQLIALAKASPDKLNYASQGTGTTAHLAAELFKSTADIKVVHIPYKGTGPALTDLLGGQVDMMFTEVSAAGPYIRDGKLRALAVGSEKRNPLLPDVASLSETLPGMVVMTWYGMVAPPGTPAAISSKLSTTVAEVLKQPDAAKRLQDLSVVGIANTPAEMATFMKQERERWGKVVRQTGAKAE
jgi:tripartite-type tricarboxylate transporter receptor subunit TctC